MPGRVRCLTGLLTPIFPLPFSCLSLADNHPHGSRVIPGALQNSGPILFAHQGATSGKGCLFGELHCHPAVSLKLGETRVIQGRGVRGVPISLPVTMGNGRGKRSQDHPPPVPELGYQMDFSLTRHTYPCGLWRNKSQGPQPQGLGVSRLLTLPHLCGQAPGL